MCFSPFRFYRQNHIFSVSCNSLPLVEKFFKTLLKTHTATKMQPANYSLIALIETIYSIYNNTP